MRWLGALALVGACGGTSSPSTPVSLVLDIPNGVLDPKGYTTVEIVLHEPDGDVTRTTAVDGSGNFGLDRIDPSNSVSVEATLRNNSGAAMGYGRTAVAAQLASGATITVPVRRPIAYVAGTVSRDADNNPQTPALHWTEAPATYADLSTSAPLDGKSVVGSNAVLMIAAGPNLFMVTQATSDPVGALTGAAQLMPLSSADHAVGTALPGTMTGAVIDGAGSDDGAQLVIGTTTQLFAVDTASGAARPLADGNFARVAILTSDTGEIDAIAIKNRGATTGACATTAELWWAPLTGGGMAHMVATGGFSDVATDRGHAYYVDACKGELGEATATTTKLLLAIPGTGTAAGATAGKPTALAVSNGQAYIGVEIPPPGTGMPATSSLLVAAIGSSDPPGTLWTERAQQVLDVVATPDVQRLLSASSVVFGHLEVGAGGDYVALSTSAHFHAAAIPNLFPEMTIDTEELRVFAAASGGVVQRYRSWCDGVLRNDGSELSGWECTAATGQSAPAADMFEHHIGSMTFLFGKK
ncbi:MAG TPA: hypothetical protein VIX73_32045 [Kofleriaceae bacterium]|jgi:hypothetical protein